MNSFSADSKAKGANAGQKSAEKNPKHYLTCSPITCTTKLGLLPFDRGLVTLISTDLDEGRAVVADVDGADDGGPLQLQHGGHLLLAGAPALPLFAVLKWKFPDF